MITRRSDALPIQMWSIDVQTFNEKRVPGYTHRNFFARFNYDSVVIDQYIGDAVYDLVITNCKGQELYRQSYVETVDGVYQLQFIPQDVIPGLSNGMMVRFCIVDPSAEDDSDTFDYSFDSSFHPDFPGMLYRSDFFKIQYTARNKCQKLNYSNVEDYAGIEGYSEEMIFELVVFGTFVEEEQIETNESEDLDDTTVVKLASSVKTQRLWEIEAAPDYYHKKILYALQHNTILMDFLYWEKEPKYEKKKLHERCALKTASVQLTLKEDDFYTNVYGPLTTE